MASENPHYPHMFAPFELSGRRLRNRIVHASISTALAEHSAVTDRLLLYYANRAKGGAAMLVTDPLGAAPHQTGPLRVGAYEDRHRAGLARWADAVESEDCRLLGQLQDPGRGRHVPGRNYEAIGASGLPDDLSWTMPHPLSVQEVRKLVQSFAETAARLKECGFSGVEISAGHGHLFHQFMSPWSNRRDDEYGGTFENRLRIVDELVAAIRHHCGDGFILGLKLPGDDGVPGGVDPALSRRIAGHLTRNGQVSYVCLAQGSHHRSLEMHVPNDAYPRVPYLPLVQALRAELADVPLMALGRITDPAEAEGILAHGDADLIGLGRPLVTDPAWPLKAEAGLARRIRYCVNANNCWNTIVGHRPIQCDNNPRVATPYEIGVPLPRAASRRRVVVVGAGIAGLEAAGAAAQRGHDVILIGASQEPGGKTRLQAQLPSSESLSSIYDFQVDAAVRAGVELRLGHTARVQDVLRLEPDTVVLATGADMVWPDSLPATLREQGLVPDLRTLAVELLRPRPRERGTAVLLDLDHGQGVYAGAELLHARFERVVLLTPRDSFAQDVPLVSRQTILRRFHALGIELLPMTEPYWTQAFEDDGALEYRHVYGGPGGRICDVAVLTYATPRSPALELYEPLRQAGVQVVRVGDAKVACTVMDATREGHAAAMTI
ncbi:FAD-dependent oxidoreductase [Verticiella sediminum]